MHVGEEVLAQPLRIAELAMRAVTSTDLAPPSHTYERVTYKHERTSALRGRPWVAQYKKGSKVPPLLRYIQYHNIQYISGPRPRVEIWPAYDHMISIL